MRIKFNKTGEIIGWSYVKTPLRSNAILDIETTENHCFNWSILGHLHPCGNSNPSSVKNF